MNLHFWILFLSVLWAIGLLFGALELGAYLWHEHRRKRRHAAVQAYIAAELGGRR
jgi:hypothetical protein